MQSSHFPVLQSSFTLVQTKQFYSCWCALFCFYQLPRERDPVGTHKWQVHLVLWYHFTFWPINTLPFHVFPAKEVTERLFHCEQLAGHMAKCCQTGKERQVPQGSGVMLSGWVNWWLTGVENGADLFLSDLSQVISVYFVPLFSYLKKPGWLSGCPLWSILNSMDEKPW